ncbi:MAG: SLC13 family permease [Bacteroidales bacterium]|nr:SLC13 family permease [Bacteroidales bacterium]
MVSFDLILVFIVITFILISLYNDLLGASFTFLIAIIVLGVFGILTPHEIISGFANEQVAVVIMLLLLGDIIRKTEVIENLFDRLFRKAKNYKGFLSRMTLIVAGFSAFLNNTPLVAIMMPYVNSWCKRNNISPSKFLIPLSYAAILGGQVTLIGTSTNLIVNGMVAEQTIAPEISSLQMFDFVWVGVPMVIIGYLYLLFFSDKILPSRAPIYEKYTGSSRQYIIEARVRNNSDLMGKTIQESGLKDLRGLYLIEMVRDSFRVSPVANDLIIEKNDVLLFAGETDDIAELIGSNSGLVLPQVGMMSKMKRTEVVEIIVSQNSSIINKTVREINFRGKYDAAVIAVHRNGETIEGKIDHIELKAGDVLLLFAGEDFNSRTSDSRDFYFMTRVRHYTKLEWWKIATLFGGTLLAILLSALHVTSLFMALIILLLVAMSMKITTPKELPHSIDYNLALIIVMSLALGTAMIKSGAAVLIADFLINIFMPMGKVGLLFGIYFITTILAAYITNKAAVGIIFPIALTIGHNLELNPLPFVLTVAYAAAANFMTPIGYQTNLMVYGPGSYSFKDFFRIGFPITIIYMIVTVAILSLVYF